MKKFAMTCCSLSRGLLWKHWPTHPTATCWMHTGSALPPSWRRSLIRRMLTWSRKLTSRMTRVASRQLLKHRQLPSERQSRVPAALWLCRWVQIPPSPHSMSSSTTHQWTISKMGVWSELCISPPGATDMCAPCRDMHCPDLHLFWKCSCVASTTNPVAARAGLHCGVN